MSRQKDRKTERQKDRKTKRQKDKKTKRLKVKMTKRLKDQETKRQKDKKTKKKKDKKIKRLIDKKTKRQRQRPKRVFNIATSGQFRTLAMFSQSFCNFQNLPGCPELCIVSLCKILDSLEDSGIFRRTEKKYIIL